MSKRQATNPDVSYTQNPATATPKRRQDHSGQMPCPGKNTSKHLLNLAKLVDLRDRKVVPKAFQINIKLTFLGRNPTREQIHKWWAAEKEAGPSLLSVASKTTMELIKRMENNSVHIQAEITNELHNPMLTSTDKELWTFFSQKNNVGTGNNNTG